ncbi:MAG: hypothetical protein QM478_11605 [Flavobacteriaceae bacterium]
MAKLDLGLKNIKEQANKKANINSNNNTDINNDNDNNKILKDLSAGMLDPHMARVDQFRYDVREQWNFKVPRVVRVMAEEKAKELGIVFKTGKRRGQANSKLFLYHCLRLAGLDIPEDDLLDARRVQRADD